MELLYFKENYFDVYPSECEITFDTINKKQCVVYNLQTYTEIAPYSQLILYRDIDTDKWFDYKQSYSKAFYYCHENQNGIMQHILFLTLNNSNDVARIFFLDSLFKRVPSVEKIEKSYYNSLMTQHKTETESEFVDRVILKTDCRRFMKFFCKIKTYCFNGDYFSSNNEQKMQFVLLDERQCIKYNLQEYANDESIVLYRDLYTNEWFDEQHTYKILYYFDKDRRDHNIYLFKTEPTVPENIYEYKKIICIYFTDTDITLPQNIKQQEIEYYSGLTKQLNNETRPDFVKRMYKTLL